MNEYLDRLRAEVRADDADRPRSRQAQIGWSEVGGCRAYVGFKLSGEWETDDADNWRAIVGTALHDYFARLRAGDGETCPVCGVERGQEHARQGDCRGRRHEVETVFGGIPGHADEVDDTSVTDWKFPTVASAEAWRRDAEAFAQKRAQVQGYAAGINAARQAEGLPPVETVRIMVCPVDGTFEDWWCHEEPFDPAVAEAAVARKNEVQRLLDDGLTPPRDMPYDWCQRFCEFFTACREPGPVDDEEITDPELAAKVRLYGELGDEVRPREKLRKRIAAEIKGLRGRAGDWRVGLTRPSGTKDVPDLAAIQRDYDERGELIPTKEVPTSAPSLMVKRIKE